MAKKTHRHRKIIATLDTDDDDSNGSSNMSAMSTEEISLDKNSFLDQALEDTYEKRGSTREKALSSIVEAFTTNLQHEFLEKNFATLLHQCLNSIKRGSAKEVSLASRLIGLLALTLGCDEDNSHELLQESVPVLSLALNSASDLSKISSLLECLAIITFVCGTETEETEKSMQIMWQILVPHSKNVVAKRIPPAVISAVVSAWSFLLTTVDRLDPKNCQDPISIFSTLLHKEDRSVRIAAGEALALVLEAVGSLAKFAPGLEEKIINQIHDLSAEAGGRGSAKKDLNNQRNLFRDISDFIEDGSCPEISLKIGGDTLSTSSWYQLIQLNFLKHFLGGGFVMHMQGNEFLHGVFGFAPKKRQARSCGVSSIEKRWYKSPNSALHKARTRSLNKQRILSQDTNAGQFAIGLGSEEAEA